MRTSGAGTESRLTVAIGLVFLGMLMVLAGGPASFFALFDQALRTLAEMVYKTWLSFRG